MASKEVTGQNQWTDTVEVRRSKRSFFSISVEDDLANGTTITLQRKRPWDSDWLDVKTFVAGDELEKNGEVIGYWDLRLGCKTGEFGAGDSPLVEVG